MIARPSLLVFAPVLGALTFVAALSITPVHVSHDRPPGAAVRFWWARLAPLGYAIHAVRSAPVVAIPRTPTYCPDPEDQTLAWLRLTAHPHADSIFRRLLLSPRPATRLYAALGLAYSESPALSPALVLMRHDTSAVRVVSWPATGFQDRTMSLAALATSDTMRIWARALSRL